MTSFKNLLNRLRGVLGFQERIVADNAHNRNGIYRRAIGRGMAARGLVLALTAVLTTASANADGHEHSTVKHVLVTLTSAETQTQGMALVLSNAMQAQGAQIELLLCDAAGSLALAGSSGERLAPRDVSPQMMLKNLMEGGAQVQVCALFLPNAGVSQTDLLEGVTPAQPRAIAERLLSENIRVFNF